MNKLFWGTVIGLIVGVLANPLMPPAFFIIGGVALWSIHRSSEKNRERQRDAEG